MERFRVELISVEDLVVNAENIEEACQWARNFIANQAKVDGPRYKLHAIYSSTPDVPRDPSPTDSVTQKVAA